MTMVAASTSGSRAIKPLLAVLVLAIVVRLIYLWVYQSLPEWDQLTVDNNYHHHWAQSIADGNIIGDTTYFRAPFYVFCLGMLYSVFGISLWVGRIFGAAIGIVSVLMTFLLGRRIANARVGTVAAVIHAVYPIVLYFEAELLLDPLFTLLLQVALYRLLIWLETKKPGEALIVGLILGLAAITRPTVLVLVPPLLIAVIIFRRSIPKYVTQLALLVIGLGIVITPVFVRNLAVAGDPVLISSQGGINFYIGNNSKADGVSAVLPEPMGHNWQLSQIKFEAEQATGHNLKPGEISSYWALQGWQWIANNHSDFVMLYLEKLYRNFANRDISNNRDLKNFSEHHPILKYNPFCFAALLGFAVVGIILRRRNVSVQLVLWLILFYTTAGAFFFFSSRFRLPLLPYFFILASIGFSDFITTPHHKKKTIIYRGTIVAGITILSCLPLIPLPAGSAPYSNISVGLYHFARGNYTAALEHHQQSMLIDSTFPEVNLNVGACFLRLGDVDSARYYFEREIKFHPDLPKAYSNLASVSLIEGKLGEAIILASQAVKLRPYDVTGHSLLLRSLFSDSSTGDFACLEAVHQAAKATGDDIYLLNEASVLLTERGMINAARETLAKAIKTTPPPIETDDEAFALIFRNSRDKFNLQRAKAFYQYGYLEGIGGNYGQSIQYSSKAIELDSSLVEAYINLISAYISTGQSVKADSILKLSRKKFPTNLYFDKFK